MSEPEIVRELRKAEEAGLLQTVIKNEERKSFTEMDDENTRLIQSIFDGLQDGLSLLDTDFNILKVNRWMEELYRDEMPVVGRKCYEVYQKRNSVCPWCPSLKALESGETRSALVPYPSAEKTIGWLELSAHPVKDENGVVVNIIEHVKDVTERKKMEEKLKEKLKELETFYKVAVDRELRMIELKREVNELCEKCGEKPRYAIDKIETGG
ncbi:MAG: PAS domain-containing protein [Thermoplasmata archaeon]|nr:PAS domain-containing protein [Thermoplasmata archaeon]